MNCRTAHRRQAAKRSVGKPDGNTDDPTGGRRRRRARTKREPGRSGETLPALALRTRRWSRCNSVSNAGLIAHFAGLVEAVIIGD